MRVPPWVKKLLASTFGWHVTPLNNPEILPLSDELRTIYETRPAGHGPTLADYLLLGGIDACNVTVVNIAFEFGADVNLLLADKDGIIESILDRCEREVAEIPGMQKNIDYLKSKGAKTAIELGYDVVPELEAAPPTPNPPQQDRLVEDKEAAAPQAPEANLAATVTTDWREAYADLLKRRASQDTAVCRELDEAFQQVWQVVTVLPASRGEELVLSKTEEPNALTLWVLRNANDPEDTRNLHVVVPGPAICDLKYAADEPQLKQSVKGVYVVERAKTVGVAIMVPAYVEPEDRPDFYRVAKMGTLEA